MEPNLLEATLAAAVKDVRTTTDEGQFLETLPEGARQRACTAIIDDRGSLFEMWNADWQFDDLPMEQIYITTLRPGIVKGWSLHKTHEDRYFVVKGVMQLVMYDVRPDSATCGKLFKVTLAEHNRRLVSIPAFVWHADYNVGSEDCYLLNMPTKFYDYANPDKVRLPIDTDLIPHDFGRVARGW